MKRCLSLWVVSFREFSQGVALFSVQKRCTSICLGDKGLKVVINMGIRVTIGVCR